MSPLKTKPPAASCRGPLSKAYMGLSSLREPAAASALEFRESLQSRKSHVSDKGTLRPRCPRVNQCQAFQHYLVQQGVRRHGDLNSCLRGDCDLDVLSDESQRASGAAAYSIV